MGQTVNLLAYAFGGSNPSPPTLLFVFFAPFSGTPACASIQCVKFSEGDRSENSFAEVAQLVEHQLPKLRVASSNLVFRSRLKRVVLRDSGRLFSFFIVFRWPGRGVSASYSILWVVLSQRLIFHFCRLFRVLWESDVFLLGERTEWPVRFAWTQHPFICSFETGC